jgi:DNA processing protein
VGELIDYRKGHQRTMESKVFWVGFNLVKGIGAVRLRALLDHFGDLSLAWDAPADALLASGLNARLVEKLIQIRSQVDLEKTWEGIEKQGIRVLTWLDSDYPERLKEIDQSPPVLYIRGTFVPEDATAVAIVGTRRVTAYGRQVADELAASLGRNGVTVISGMARGTDAVAHQSVIKAGGRTVAVLGCGVDRIYPPENRQLAEQIMAHGCMLSDYPVGTVPEGSNFPPRNRIISGLSLATVVIEAGEESGALITASFAAEQGREIFAVPGGIYAPQSKGTNRLIQQGATPLLVVQDVLEALNLAMVSQQNTARRVLPADALEASIYQALGSDPLHVDEICVQLNQPIEKLSAALAMMELKGMVRQVGGMNYVAIREAFPEYGVEG